MSSEYSHCNGRHRVLPKCPVSILTTMEDSLAEMSSEYSHCSRTQVPQANDMSAIQPSIQPALRTGRIVESGLNYSVTLVKCVRNEAGKATMISKTTSGGQW